MAEHQKKPVSSPDAKTTSAEKPLKPRPVRPPLKLIPDWQLGMGQNRDGGFTIQCDPPRAICTACNGTGTEIKGHRIGKSPDGNNIYSKEGGVQCTLCGGNGLGALIELKE